jgi:nucleotide-binding universal stress UspA family protein
MGVIVVATDGSVSATAALDAAVALAAQTGDRLAIITVWRALQGDYGLVHPSSAVLDDVLDAERRHAEQTLADALERATDAGVPADVRLATGDPAERICIYARERDARLVAMGTHGYGAVMTLLLGSVSGSVLRKCGLPVLVVPEPHADDAEQREQASAGRHGGASNTHAR